MQDTRFYLEFPDERTKKCSGKTHAGHSGNVLAVFPDLYHRMTGDYDCLGSVSERPNSPPASTAVSRDYLRQCKRISEAKAREIHPELFKYLESQS